MNYDEFMKFTICFISGLGGLNGGWCVVMLSIIGVGRGSDGEEEKRVL